jgi:hypothetical protein
MPGPPLLCLQGHIFASNSQYGFSGPEFNAQAELVEAHTPFDKLRANGKSSK